MKHQASSGCGHPPKPFYMADHRSIQHANSCIIHGYNLYLAASAEQWIILSPALHGVLCPSHLCFEACRTLGAELSPRVGSMPLTEVVWECHELSYSCRTSSSYNRQPHRHEAQEPSRCSEPLQAHSPLAPVCKLTCCLLETVAAPDQQCSPSTSPS